MNTLEIGDMSNAMMSPAQISFLIMSTIAPHAPSQAVLSDSRRGQTLCSKCHDKHFGTDIMLSSVDGTPVYGMGQILPFPQFDERVPTVISLAQGCTETSERCAIFHALTCWFSAHLDP